MFQLPHQKKNLVLVLIFFFWCCLPLLALAKEASFFFFPSSNSFEIGETLTVKIKVATDFPINAAQSTIHFPVEKLEVVNISKKDSIFSLWPKPPSFSNESGIISFSGGKPTPGFKGTGEILSIYFKGKAKGSVSLVFGEARILADDGKGTDILSSIKEAKFLILEQAPLEISSPSPPEQVPLPPEIFSLTHPEETEWYNNNSPEFYWSLEPDIRGVSFLLDQLPDSIPDTYSEGLIKTKSYQNLEDGVWYFHLRVENKNGWSETSHYKIQIDTQPPGLEIVIDNAGDPTNLNPDLYLKAQDNISGVHHYRLKIDQKDFLALMKAEVNPFPLSLRSPGEHLIIVRALDYAGNAKEKKTILNVEPIETPKITLLPKQYIAGEETLYIEGTALPDVEVLILLERDGKTIKEWSTKSNQEGNWFFWTEDLIKSGVYDLSVQARDNRGRESYPSERYQIQVKLSGVAFGPLIITFQNLVFCLLFVLVVGIILLGYFFFKMQYHKRVLEKEIQEAKRSVEVGFEDLKNKIKEQIRMFDSKPEFSPHEKEVYEKLRAILKRIEDSIAKEVKDIEDLEKGIKK